MVLADAPWQRRRRGHGRWRRLAGPWPPSSRPVGTLATASRPRPGRDRRDRVRRRPAPGRPGPVLPGAGRGLGPGRVGSRPLPRSTAATSSTPAGSAARRRSTSRWRRPPTSARGARSPTPSPPSPTGPSPGTPGPPTSTSSEPTYVLYFTAMVRGTSPAMECIGDAVGSAPGRPVPPPAGRRSSASGDQGGSIDPRVFTDARRHQLDAVEVRPEHRRVDHPHQAVVAAADRRRAGPHRSARRPDGPRRAVAGHHRRGAGHGRGRAAPTGSSTRATGSTSRPTPSGPPGARARPGPCCRPSPRSPCSAPTPRGRGPGEASVFDDPSGVWMLYSAAALTRSPWPSYPRGRWSSPGSVSAPTGPYLAAGGHSPEPRCPRRRDLLRPVSPVAGAARRRPPCRRPGPWSPSSPRR